MSLTLAIIGHPGRMARAVAAAVADDPRFAPPRLLGRADDVAAGLADAGVALELSVAGAVAGHAALAAAAGRPLVVGVTGLDAATMDALGAAARTVPVLVAANFSPGMALLTRLVRQAAAALGPDWDIEISETHHRAKADAPSGSALALGRAAAGARGGDLAALRLPPRDGQTGPRAPGGIGFAVRRGGAVAGDHGVAFLGDSEVLELHHRALSRDVFARGALLAALWLKDRGPGLYGMEDALGGGA